MAGDRKTKGNRRLRSREWFDAPGDPTMAALYLERYMNFGLTLAELHSGRPIIGIAQTGSDLSPCNRHHLDLASRVRDGIRDAGGIPIEFPVHPIQETGKRPTASLDRNLAYLSLVECLYGYFFDGVVLTTGCDKTTPAMIMGAATVNIPAIVLSGGPMLDGHFAGGLAGSGTIVWYARQELAAGRINLQEFLEWVAGSAPSVGHCNTMGTALSMNSMAEALGMSLPGCAAIPGPYRERGQMAYETGKRIVDMVWEDLKPSDILTRKAFENAITTVIALGGSTNAVLHLLAIAAEARVKLKLDDFTRVGKRVPVLADLRPSGRYLMSELIEIGGIRPLMKALLDEGLLHGDVLTVTGRTLKQDLADAPAYPVGQDVVRPFSQPIKRDSHLIVMYGNLAPEGAVAKLTGKEGLSFSGRARVYDSEERCLQGILDATAINVTPETRAADQRPGCSDQDRIGGS